MTSDLTSALEASHIMRHTNRLILYFTNRVCDGAAAAAVATTLPYMTEPTPLGRCYVSSVAMPTMKQWRPPETDSMSSSCPTTAIRLRASQRISSSFHVTGSLLPRRHLTPPVNLISALPYRTLTSPSQVVV